MKKIRFFGLAALLALGFGFMGCDGGVASDEFDAATLTGTDAEKAWQEEVPTNYYEYEETLTGTVDAVWDFSSFVNGTADTTWGIPASDTAITELEEMEPSSGEGATLSLYGNVKTNAEVLQGGKNTSTMDDYANTAKSYLTLTLDDVANIVVKAKGAGATDSARYIVITDADDTPLVYKDNLSSGKDVIFCVKDAPAGTYTIYNNGSSIYYVDCSKSDSADETKEPSQVAELLITTAQADIAAFEAYETLTLDVVDTADTDTSLTADAVWTSSDESVATVKAGVVTGVAAGTAVIRARIGRFYDQRTVTVTASTKTRATFLSASSMPSEATTWATATDAVKEAVLTPMVLGNFATVSNATLTISDAVEEWSDEPTLAAKGGATSSYKFGFYWKDALSANASADTTVATLKFTVTPTSGTVKLNTLAAQTYNGKGAGGAKIKLTAGSDSGTILSTKADSVDSAELGDIEISEATEVTVEIQIASGKKGVSCGVQDLALIITQ